MAQEPEDPRCAENRAKVAAWLQEDGFVVNDTPSDSCAWNLFAASSHRMVSVSQNRDEPERVILYFTFPVDQRVRANPEVGWTIAMGLAQLGVDPRSFSLPLGDRLEISTYMYSDELSKPELRKAIRLLWRASLFSILVMRKASGESQPYPHVSELPKPN